MTPEFTRPSHVDSIERVEVLRVQSITGSGRDGDPWRTRIEYWSTDDEARLLAAEPDTWCPPATEDDHG